jgi:hypothetical protein
MGVWTCNVYKCTASVLSKKFCPLFFQISGIGKVTESMLKALDVTICEHLYEKRTILYHLYSPISFNYFMRICIGVGSTKVER